VSRTSLFVLFLDDDVAQEGKKMSESVEFRNLELPQNFSSQHPLGVVPDDRTSQLTQELVEKGEVGASSYLYVFNLNPLS
jgi:hypothetical protein